jgi:hypothetical protein
MAVPIRYTRGTRKTYENARKQKPKRLGIMFKALFSFMMLVRHAVAASHMAELGQIDMAKKTMLDKV